MRDMDIKERYDRLIARGEAIEAAAKASDLRTGYLKWVEVLAIVAFGVIFWPFTGSPKVMVLTLIAGVLVFRMLHLVVFNLIDKRALERIDRDLPSP